MKKKHIHVKLIRNIFGWQGDMNEIWEENNRAYICEKRKKKRKENDLLGAMKLENPKPKLIKNYVVNQSPNAFTTELFAPQQWY